ncbi:hypothetical protein A3742_03540 [Oleiphilus sp. HI0071]|uniref:DUF2788 domain-containing protein n=1 Tax=unclassified Oleiphilus TaxID=2631174 RepID=UPI0007C39B89|nr:MULTISPECIES: DUF2788 domain-containing protein [unclassified Oleiphilus]KZY63570.1 hypothetical protein A3737_14515 [Oleiphilus sp. HI0065]KZY85427.1 hypothetical protein A3742_29480 [Oleiphilus sp. HI0071]KZY97886.1 hypothetical protein A3744_01545 [Oleiphilus sp. HI0073]KZZ43387.1 hypothetical protein A3758_20080 [Oleiphilus sp. HI0118]KZZ61830.1 hypothetical protein A3760_00020 [Oleiphilus sp. HI0122]KZZ66406.1 hypothetical protein A3765_05210 [Oleiphilus sp. HI0130]KZZ78993.1 hypothe
MSVETFETWSLTIGITVLIAYMAYIVWDLAKKSDAGKFGTVVLFAALGMGAAGFVIKAVLVETLQL